MNTKLYFAIVTLKNLSKNKINVNNILVSFILSTFACCKKK